jgi:hypothetical protein
MGLMIALIAAVLGAVLFRIRGGWQPFGLRMPGTTAGRLAWALPMGGVAALAAGDVLGLLAGPLLWASVVPGWGSYMDLGRGDKPDNESLRRLVRLTRLPDGSFWYDFVGLALRGLVLTAPAGIALSFLASMGWALIPAGIAMAPLYWLGWKLGGTEPAEFLYGAWVGAAIALASL